ncbi:hypothetical protein FHS59_002982 [Algoriphagus iocasae]|uniref:Uncharacterized protein n=1 Tax=Algoriphagus iocasae TaxID=1836499 RepID=A0A841MP68_9BACT|nr:hypothetical protein [Algoriphagus iocasae]
MKSKAINFRNQFLKRSKVSIPLNTFPLGVLCLKLVQVKLYLSPTKYLKNPLAIIS